MMGETKQMVLLKGIELPNSSLEHDESTEKNQPPPVSVPKVTPTPPPATPPPQPTPPPINKIPTPISTANPSTPISGQQNVQANNHPPMSTPIPPTNQVQPQVPPKVIFDQILSEYEMLKYSRFGLVFSNGKLHLLKKSYHFNATFNVKNRNSFKVVMLTNGLTIQPYYKSNSFNNLFSNSSKV